MKQSLSLTLVVILLLLTSQCLAQSGRAAAKLKLDTLIYAQIGGIKQVIEIRTEDVSRPVLLFLSGGPGSSMMTNAVPFTNALKNRFTIVQWDQRDAGKTLKLNPSPTRPTLGLMAQDTYEVINMITERFKQKKIYLLGSSWGNALGFSIVKKYPQKLHAYFAVNPVISQLQSERELLITLKNDLRDNKDASEELNKVNIPFRNDEDLFYLRKWLFYKEGKTFVTNESFKTGFLQWSKTWSATWNEVMGIDLTKTLKTVQCPVYFFVGKNDIQTLTSITIAYFKALKAPKKELFIFEHSGHQIHQEEPEKLQKAIIQVIDEI